MNDDHKIPASWAMPDDLAKKVTKGLNRKTLRPEDELADALEEMARDIALIEPDPMDWGGWVIYFLEQLEGEAHNRAKKFSIEKMHKSLIDYFESNK